MSRLETKILISYRRDDSPGTAGRIFDRLVERYGRDRVFMDIDNMPFGVDFEEHLREVLNGCGVLLAIIGPDWIGRRRGKPPRIKDEHDWVRLEVETALNRQIPVAPVLVDGADLPKQQSLPATLHALLRRNALPVDSGRDFNAHVTRMIAGLDQLLGDRSGGLDELAGDEGEGGDAGRQTPHLPKRDAPAPDYAQVASAAKGGEDTVSGGRRRDRPTVRNQQGDGAQTAAEPSLDRHPAPVEPPLAPTSSVELQPTEPLETAGRSAAPTFAPVQPSSAPAAARRSLPKRLKWLLLLSLIAVAIAAVFTVAWQRNYTTTASGLQYRVIKAGQGPNAGPNDLASINYIGRLEDGTVFDSNQSGQPVALPVNETIEGLSEALQLMNKGATYRLRIPPGLAYGAQGAGGVIPPNATLEFDVTLVDRRVLTAEEIQQMQMTEMMRQQDPAGGNASGGTDAAGGREADAAASERNGHR
jgi:DNA-binding transcriptional regulator of glucitol operon